MEDTVKANTALFQQEAGATNYSREPLLIYWELTRSCDLACKHCRAEAFYRRSPNELSTLECYRTLDSIKRFGTNPGPHIVFTGGDPLKRPDLIDILRYTAHKGLSFSLAPSATHLLNLQMLEQIKELGVKTVSLSIDGENEKSHDAFRGVPGCFSSTIEAAKMLNSLDIPMQINTLVCRDTLESLPGIYEQLLKMKVIRWSVFFLIQTGRGAKLQSITPAEAEAVMNWLYDLTQKAPFSIKTTEAPHYRRIAMEKATELNHELPVSIVRGQGIRDGNGIMFINHNGDVYPSGFLPVSAGNVKQVSPLWIYRESELFNRIRQPENFKGKCGYCEFNRICGGSRARAYGWTGDPYASDPLCMYKPQQKEKSNNEFAESF